MEYADYDEEEILSPMDYVDESYIGEDLSHKYVSQDELGGGPAMDFWEMMEYCVEPTSRDGLSHLGKVLFWTLIFRLLTQTGKVPSWAHHSVSSLCGIFVLAHFFHSNVVYIMGLLVLSYLALLLSCHWNKPRRGPLLLLLCLLYNSICELMIAIPVDWHQIRGVQMILSMKIISLGFDMDSASNSEPPTTNQENNEPLSKKDDRQKSHRRRGDKLSSPTSKGIETLPVDLKQMPKFMELAGYFLNPGTCVFGPWTKYEDYINIFREPIWNFAWTMKIFFSLVSAFVFLSISTCWNSWMIHDGSWKWSIAYRDAMSFRASHYFVSFMSEATAVTAGFGYSKVEKSWSDLTVSSPNSIEMPRSLVEVVVSWNIPMHQWLKTYCFKTAKPYGNFVAIVSTYIASAFLHGFNFQLAAVLLSLGIYTFVEYEFRRKLSNIFDASMEARSNSKTVRKHTEKEFVVIVCNILFGILACFHLAYLGVMFGGQSSPLEAEGNSWKHTLNKWRNLGFLSHYIVVFTYSISLLL
ncbi:protein-serine O-palmitoleoyltransferase porcupine [Lepeophtheirus salmonis]|nr:protein-serine O-palmitoleoyltransferase porcupine-like [Lepeophtheirus salmonis]